MHFSRFLKLDNMYLMLSVSSSHSGVKYPEFREIKSLPIQNLHSKSYQRENTEVNECIEDYLS